MLWQKLGRSYLSFDGFSRVIKDIEIVFNNRPLQYVEDEFGSRVLTPNSWKKCLLVRRYRRTR